ncbi:hypothetical protein BRC79_02695 [Halobacteriales archaeon QH_8_67_27]|nr:MAG: hypothetical protein BRC79_02695 [Halobacteriales archaeon QH_8_67_27]
MATQEHWIVDGGESTVHDEPHIAESRITVRSVHESVESGDIDPETVAARHNLDIAAVYHALAYYHEHPERMRAAEREREETVEANRDRAVTGPDDLE